MGSDATEFTFFDLGGLFVVVLGMAVYAYADHGNSKKKEEASEA